MQHPGPWRYERGTRTIRSVPENYWLATLDSWDGAVDNEANAPLMAAAPELAAELQRLVALIEREDAHLANFGEVEAARALLARVRA